MGNNEVVVDDVIVELLKNGVLGAAVVGLSVYVWRMFRALQKVQESRVSEAHEVSQQLLGLAQNWSETISAQTTMVERLSESVSAGRSEATAQAEATRLAIRELLTDLKAEINRRGGQR